jgi:hypothetical protein
MDITFPQLNIFPEFALHFSSPDYKILPDFTFCSSVPRISSLRQQTSLLVRYHKWFSLEICTTNWQVHSCKWFAHTIWLQWGLLHKREFLHHCSPSSLCIRPALILLQSCITITQWEPCVFVMCDERSKKMTIAIQRVYFRKWNIQQKCTFVNAAVFQCPCDFTL